MKLEIIMLDKTGQTPKNKKNKCCIFSLICKIQRKKNKERRQVSRSETTGERIGDKGCKKGLRDEHKVCYMHI
jgi:hypothetical protein